jgi:hypothetical protein
MTIAAMPTRNGLAIFTYLEMDGLARAEEVLARGKRLKNQKKLWCALVPLQSTGDTTSDHRGARKLIHLRRSVRAQRAPRGRHSATISPYV